MSHGDLFEGDHAPVNLLPRDGEAYYLGRMLSEQEATLILECCVDELSWAHDRLVLFGKTIVTQRKVAWYGDASINYTYSGQTRTAQPWPEHLWRLKTRVEQECGERFNSCLANLYHSGEEGMGWHSDDEKELAPNGVIASLTLGGERRFSFKHKQDKERVSLELEHGSLLIMQGATQTHWWHSLPKTRKSREVRVNLTFRQMRC
ncbi:alpha-ketoglutarate-dependent dioxygenase AlkB family protein [Vreelandella sp. EE22]